MSRRLLLPLRQWSLVRRFTALALAVTVATGLAVAVVADLTLDHSALDAEAESVAQSVRARLVPFLREDDLSGPLAAGRWTELDRRIRDTALDDPDRVGTVLWNADGTVVYSTDPAAVGRRAHDADELAEALTGRLMRETKPADETEIRLDRSGLRTVMEVYVPLRAAGTDRVIGVFEIYHDTAASDRRLDAARRAILLVLLPGLAAVLLVLLTVVRDASRRLRAQAAELARVTATAEADRMQTEFVAVVSHELRTPLTGMVGFSELLLDADVPEADRRRWTELLHSGAQRLHHLVDELLDVTRIDEGRMSVDLRPVDVADVVERALEPFHPLPAGTELVSRVRRDALPLVAADPDRLLQVLVNVVSNALKYSPDGGKVVVDARRAGRRVRLVVSDEGLGIPAGDLPRVFDRFHRVRDESRQGIEGSGLGLYIAHRLVLLQGGTIRVTSAGPGRGTTVEVELPVVRPAEPVAVAGPVAGPVAAPAADPAGRAAGRPDAVAGAGR